MAISNIFAGGFNNNGSAIMTTGSSVTNTRQVSVVSANSDNIVSTSYPGVNNGLFSAFQSDDVAITSVTQYLTSGRCLITKSTHGLTAGQAILVEGTNVVGYNRTHIVVDVVNANTFSTNVAYTDDTTTHGVYRTIERVMESKELPVIARGLPADIAGVTSNNLLFGSVNPVTKHMINFNRRINIISWDYVTGAATKGANAGAVNTYINPNDGTPAVNSETFAASMYPAQVTYMYGGPNPTTDDYRD